MARPAYSDNQMTSKERIENTFWEMLSSTKYEHITVKELCKRAAVNQNTFYYHFGNIDALAVGVFEKDKISKYPMPFFTESSMAALSICPIASMTHRCWKDGAG